MPIGSGQVSFGTINTEISWASNRANTYFVNAGPTGATYSSYTTQSLYGYYGMKIIALGSVNDYLDGNYDFVVDQTTCEGDFIPVPPQSSQADANVSWSWDVEYFDAFTTGNSFISLAVLSGNTQRVSSFSFLCYVPGLCSIVNWVCFGPSPGFTGSSSIEIQTTFYIGYFRNTSRFKDYDCNC